MKTTSPKNEEDRTQKRLCYSYNYHTNRLTIQLCIFMSLLACDVPGGRKAVPRVCDKPECGDGMWEYVPSCYRKPNGCDQNMTDLFGKI